jgi:hypothetical protein
VIWRFFGSVVVVLLVVYRAANKLTAAGADFTKFMTCFISIAAVLGMLGYMIFVLYVGLFGATNDQAKGLLGAPLVNVGLPVAVVASLALVTLLPLTTTSNEPLEFKGLGLEIKGPAAQIVLWAMCFIVIVGGMVAVATLGPKHSESASNNSHEEKQVSTSWSSGLNLLPFGVAGRTAATVKFLPRFSLSP